MKKILLPVLACGMYVGAFAQNPAIPCCSISNINSAAGIVLVRNNTTGRLQQFHADAIDIKALRANDLVSENAESKKITSINNAGRTYALVEPDYGSPCCSIINISPDPAGPCCTIVTAKSLSNSNTTSFSVPLAISKKLKINQAVSIMQAIPPDGNKFQPVDGNKFQPVDGYAILQLAAGSGVATYSYPITNGDKHTMPDKDVSLQKTNSSGYEITDNPSIKGATGKICVRLPDDAVYVIGVYTATDNKYLNVFTKGENIRLLPGVYKITLSSVGVPDVEVKKGGETRLKAGVLNLTSALICKLYDQTENTYFDVLQGPKKIGLPEGTYKIDLNGQFQEITIKDGEVTDF